MYYLKPLKEPPLEGAQPLDFDASLLVMPSLEPGDRVICACTQYGLQRAIVCSTEEDLGRLLQAASTNRLTELRWLHNLPLAVSSLDDPSIEQASVVGGKVIRRGDRVKHFAERYTGEATATVIGFYNERSEESPWVRVVVLADDSGSIFASRGLNPGWDWDRTEPAPDVVVF